MPTPITRLQVQVEPLKRGTKPHRWYDAASIREVAELHVDDNGATGRVDGHNWHDAHHIAHPRTRNRGPISAMSIGFTSHYRLMRRLFGAHVTDGVAGENVLVDTDELVSRDQLEGAALRTRDGGVVPFVATKVAEPCVEFSRYVLQIAPGDGGSSMREPLQQLRGGVRGFYVSLASPVDLQAGDELVLTSVS